MEGTGDCELEVMADGPAGVEEPVYNNMVPSGILCDRVSCRCIFTVYFSGSGGVVGVCVCVVASSNPWHNVTSGLPT